MKRLMDRLSAGDILVADGAMGTMLLERGLEPGQCPESVVLSEPHVLEEIAEAYFRAGADIIETNTFGASPLKLARSGWEHEMENINRGAVLAARKVVGDRAYVAGCCGSSGRLLKPYGDTDPKEVYESFRRQLTCLIDAGIDAVLVETMTDLAEAKLLVTAGKDVSPDTPVLATMTFDATPRGFYTLMGVTIEAAADGLREAGADAVGSNCGQGIESMIQVAKRFRDVTTLPLVIQPNAGLPRMRDGRTVYDETPAFMAEKAEELLAIGVSVIGGCCGTTPDHIRAIRVVVDARSGA